MLKGSISFDGVGRRHLLRNHPNMDFRHLLGLSVHSLKLGVCVEACCCEKRLCLDDLELGDAAASREEPPVSRISSGFLPFNYSGHKPYIGQQDLWAKACGISKLLFRRCDYKEQPNDS